MKKFTFLFAAMMACATMFAENPVITNDSLWNEFKPYYNEYYGVARADQPITGVAVYLSAGMGDDATIFTSEDSKYKWLGDFIQEVAGELSNLVAWKFNVQAFFNKSPLKEGYAGNADFSGAGEPAVWNELYHANMQATPETPSAVENTTVAVKAQKIIRNGQVLMVRDGKTFNMMGVEVK